MSLSRRSSSRRAFLQTSALAAGAAASALSIGRSAHAAGSDVLKIGLVGCGGRGTGAAGNAMTADKNTKLVAMADAFEDRLAGSLQSLQKQEAFKDQIDVPKDRCFVGFDAYKQLIDSGVDVVLLCETPHFRPMHLKYAIDAGKHVFCEKPVAVDAPGVRSILETSKLAAEKKLNLVSGLCWRYHTGVKETMKRVLDGAIGDIIAVQETYLTGTLWHRGRQPDWTEMQYQMRNWYYYTWLSGDHNVEQHIHSLDKAMWINHDKPPVEAWGLGGRQVRTDAKWGDIYDHHAVVYQWDKVPVYAFTRQQGGCFNDTNDLILGTKGQCSVLKHEITGPNAWKYTGPKSNMYVAEHEALFGALRAGQVINNGTIMAQSTMLAILGRMVDYTGKKLTWEQALASEESLVPEAYTWDAKTPSMPDKDCNYAVAMPGVTQFR